MCASSNWSLVRASITTAPSAIADSTARGESGVGVPRCSSRGPRLRATTCSTFGGGLARVEIASATKASTSANSAAWLWRSSKPIVDEVRWSSPEPPQSEPPRCPGQTSTVSGSANSRSCSER